MQIFYSETDGTKSINSCFKMMHLKHLSLSLPAQKSIIVVFIMEMKNYMHVYLCTQFHIENKVLSNLLDFVNITYKEENFS